MVRQLLRWGGAKEVRAVVRSTDEVEAFGRLSLETGAEDGRGTISPVWVTRQVSFEFTEAMASYNLDRLTVVAGNLMDADFVADAAKGCDAVVFCAAPSQRVLADKLPFKLPKWGGGPAVTLVKGSVACEGVALAAEALAKDLKRRRFIGAGTQPVAAAAGRRSDPSENTDPTRFVLLSCARDGGGLPGLGGLGGPKGSPEQRGGEAELARLAALPGTCLTYTIARCAAFDLSDWDFGAAPLRVRSPEEEEKEGGKAAVARAGAAAFLAGALVAPELRDRAVCVAATPGWVPPPPPNDTEAI